MLDDLLSHVAPHLCFDCGKLGSPLCEDCKYNIVNDVQNDCIECGVFTGQDGICNSCELPYSKGWYVGAREATLRRLIDVYKFEHARAIHRSLAELLEECLPQLPPQTIIVPIPTIPPHIRERGYDHALLLAKKFGKLRQLKTRRLLYRKTFTRQRDANKSLRDTQAQRAFGLKGKIDKTCPYLIIDDIITTGATVKYAAKLLKDAGASEVWVAVIARQPLD